MEGCGLCSGKGASAEVLFDTLQQMKDQLAPDDKIYPGHCYGQPLGQPFKLVQQFNIYLNFKHKSDFVAFRMRGNQHQLFSFK